MASSADRVSFNLTNSFFFSLSRLSLRPSMEALPVSASQYAGSISSPVEYWLTLPSRVTRPMTGHFPFFFNFCRLM